MAADGTLNAATSQIPGTLTLKFWHPSTMEIYSSRIKEARHCEPASLHFDLTVLFSLDPLSSVLSFSF
jgi:hypothetical protein